MVAIARQASTGWGLAWVGRRSLTHQGTATCSGPEGKEFVVADEPLTQSLAALSRFFVGDGTLEETLTRVTDLTVEAIAPAESRASPCGRRAASARRCSPTRRRPRSIRRSTTAARGLASKPSTAGASREIRSTRRPVARVPPRAADHGILSTLSLPLIAEKAAVGAMNLYSRRERGIRNGRDEIGSMFAAQAAIVLANAQAYWDAHELSAGLSEAMPSRAVIEQAKGMLMAAQGCDADDAFELW